MSNFITEDFEPSSAAAWKQKIQFDLKGADYNETLLTKTNEGIIIKPFYHLDNFEKLTIPPFKGGFKICKKILITNESDANLKALDAINLGADSLKFIAENPFKIKAVFENLLKKNIEFHFQLNFLEESFITKLMTVLKDESVYYNIDIIGNLSKNGNWFHSFKEDFKIIESLLKINQSNTLLSVDSSIYQNAGANIVQQVAYALCHANEYLTRFKGGIPKNIQFNFATGSNYFFEISKIRAFRYLFHLILNEYNEICSATIYSEPSLRNKTIFNAGFNDLRAHSENMSAILGGANTIESQLENISSYNSIVSNAHKVATDSYFIESITKQIAEKSLAIFKDIEKSGGFLSQLKEGTIQRKIRENAQKEQTQFNSGKLILVGTNKYSQIGASNINLELPSFLDKKSRKTLIIPINPSRLADKLEQKRKKDEA